MQVSEINSLIKTFVRERFYNLCIVGEVSTFRPSANGHWYFKLKDSTSQIDAVMFRSANALCGFVPSDGDKVEVRGSIDVYEARGTYQIIVQDMRKEGLGDILAQLQKRKEYYQSLGWFESEGKPALPLYPRNIGVITAATGAAIKDILDTTGRRAGNVDVTVFPVLVQGPQAAPMIAAAIRQANDLALCDVLIVGRGGGSVEDLLPFSEDEVIRAIHESGIPVISAVGHEIDNALSDYVASARAITPTDGACIATEGWYRIRQKLEELPRRLAGLLSAKAYRVSSLVPAPEHLRSIMLEKVSRLEPADIGYLDRLMDQRVNSLGMRLYFAADSLAGAVSGKTDAALRQTEELSGACEAALVSRLDRLEHRLAMAAAQHPGELLSSRAEALKARLSGACGLCTMLMGSRIARTADRLEGLTSQLAALDPDSVLRRGYAIVRDESGAVVTGTGRLAGGQLVDVTVAHGSFRARVQEEKE